MLCIEQKLLAETVPILVVDLGFIFFGFMFFILKICISKSDFFFFFKIFSLIDNLIFYLDANVEFLMLIKAYYYYYFSSYVNFKCDNNLGIFC